MSEEVEIGTDVSGLVGRTIVTAQRDPKSGEEWGLYEESLTLTLDDGTEWHFAGYGYDASGLDIHCKFPASQPNANQLISEKL
jgi:hypothetical protein